ncbi:MAG: hypothetical protein U0559_11985 [Anaerolineae bacterium]
MSRSHLLPPLLIIGLIIIAVVVILITTSASAAVTVEWSTASELNTAGFNLYRADRPDGPFTQINSDLIPASPDPLVGGSYAFTDTHVIGGQTYYYKLEDVETSGAKTDQGTVQVVAEGGPSPALIIVAGAVACLLVGVIAFRPRKR